MVEQDFWTVNEFANKLRLHPNTIRRAIKEGRIQAFRSSNGEKSSYRIPSTEVKRLCELDMTKLIEEIVEFKINEKKTCP